MTTPRAFWRRKTGFTWWDDDGPVTVGMFHPERFVLTNLHPAEETPRCECLENGHVCAYCRSQKPWRHPLAKG